MAITEFTPLSALTGGALIGASAVMLMALKGRIAGISGIVARLLPPYTDGETPGRVAFIAGLVLAPVLFWFVTGEKSPVTIETSVIMLLVAGLLVGFGSVLGSGCTSGHGVCGLSRFSPRSMVAIVTFMTTAAVTVFLLRHVF